jgi:FKBP-type peptidyl-prolyl cis-trans isomerase
MRMLISIFLFAAAAVPTSLGFSPAVLPTLSTTRSQQKLSPLFAETEESQSDVSAAEPDSHEELMYALGVNLARQLGDVRPLVENGEELAQVARGLLDTVVGRLTEEGQQVLLGKRGKELNQLITDRASKIKNKMEQDGRDMLKQMEEKEGVIKMDSGVMIDVLEDGPDGPGAGLRATQASTVKVHYHGTLADGTVFDSTLGSDPVTFPLNGVVPGWRDGVLKMHEGETAMIGIPPEQGYGSEGTPDGGIPGGSTLFFKIQLLEILSASIGGGPSLLGADGQKLKKNMSGGLLGADGKPL